MEAGILVLGILLIVGGLVLLTVVLLQPPASSLAPLITPTTTNRTAQPSAPQAIPVDTQVSTTLSDAAPLTVEEDTFDDQELPPNIPWMVGEKLNRGEVQICDWRKRPVEFQETEEEVLDYWIHDVTDLTLSVLTPSSIIYRRGPDSAGRVIPTPHTITQCVPGRYHWLIWRERIWLIVDGRLYSYDLSQCSCGDDPDWIEAGWAPEQCIDLVLCQEHLFITTQLGPIYEYRWDECSEQVERPVCDACLGKVGIDELPDPYLQKCREGRYLPRFGSSTECWYRLYLEGTKVVKITDWNSCSYEGRTVGINDRHQTVISRSVHCRVGSDYILCMG